MKTTAYMKPVLVAIAAAGALMLVSKTAVAEAVANSPVLLAVADGDTAAANATQGSAVDQVENVDNTADVKAPEVEDPDITNVDVEVQEPEVESPDVQLPEFESPDVEMPDVDVPEAHIPDIEIPDTH